MIKMNLVGLTTENPPTQEFPNRGREKNYGSRPKKSLNSIFTNILIIKSDLILCGDYYKYTQVYYMLSINITPKVHTGLLYVIHT